MLPFPYKLLRENELRRLIKEAHLTPQQQAKLEKLLEQRRKELAEALKLVEKGLLELRKELNEKLPSQQLVLPHKRKRRKK
jgi:hypothetical protein